MKSKQDLSRYLQPPLAEARLARQWGNVQSRLSAPSRVSQWYLRGAVSFALVAMIALGVTLAWKRAPHDAGLVAGAVLETGVASKGTQITLSEGSRLVLEQDSKVTLAELGPSSVRIEVERGGVAVEATHRAGRSFTVVANGHEVRVTGTRFVVRRLAFAIEVHVDEGSVSVKGPDGAERTVRAGETWRQENAHAQAEPQPETPAQAPEDAGAEVLGDAQATFEPPAIESAKAMFDEAQRARRAGRTAEAARLFDKLRRTHRRDPRAALAAFELGRLRLDALGDARGAEEALRDAMALGPASPFREDAEARHVQALAKMGDMKGCARARDAYVSRYPSGVYRNAVSVYCGGP